MDQTIIAYRGGTFSKESAPRWLVEILSAAAESTDWDKALHAILGRPVSFASIEEHGWIDGRVMAWKTPDGGFYVEMWGGEYCHAEIWLPDATDWLPFNSTHVEPFLRTRAAMRHLDALDRLTNAFIAFARHGAGEHVDRDSGKSRIDLAADRRRYAQEQSGAVAPASQC